jgi:hypothetical protein
MAVRVGSVKINKSALMDAVGKAPGMIQYFAEAARQAADAEFEIAKDAMLSYFDEHKVTQELEAGETAESKFLPFGNLFSFLGFDAGSTPTQSLREALEDETHLRFDYTRYVNPRLGIYRYYFPVLVPDRKDIERYTHEDLERWSSESWVYQIEEGISNLNRYLFDRDKIFNNSASGPAIQVKSEVHPNAEFSGTQYISDVLAFLQKTLNS